MHIQTLFFVLDGCILVGHSEDFPETSIDNCDDLLHDKHDDPYTKL